MGSQRWIVMGKPIFELDDERRQFFGFGGT
jgi:hypothetical protein